MLPRRAREDRLLVTTLFLAALTVGIVAVSVVLVLTSCSPQGSATCDPDQATGVGAADGASLVGVPPTLQPTGLPTSGPVPSGGATGPVSAQAAPSLPAGAGGTRPDVPPSTHRQVDAVALAARITAAVQARGSARFSLSASGPRPVAGLGVARYRDGSVDLDMRLTVGQEATRTLLTSRSVFFAPPQGLAGRSWIRVPRGGSVPLVSDWADVVGGVSQAAQPWRNAWSGAEVIDTGVVIRGGLPARRYLVRLEDAGPLGEVLAGGTAAGSAAATAEVYLGHGDLPLEVVLTAARGGTSSQATVTYGGWGSPVTVVAPPSGQVVEAETTQG